MRPRKIATAAVTLLLIQLQLFSPFQNSTGSVSGIAPAFAATEMIGVTTPPALPSYRSAFIAYKLATDADKIFIATPSNFSGRQYYGLVVFMDSSNIRDQLPDGWEDVLNKRKLIFVAPQNAGNNQDKRQRCWLAVLAASVAMQKFSNVDNRRIYVSGLSGGARVASSVAINQLGLFKGTIQSCGSNFPGKIQWKSVQPASAEDASYGQGAATAEEINYARSHVKFGIITGAGDFRHGFLQDIYNDGFVKTGFQARLFDVPGMGHQICDGKTLDQVLNYLEY